MNFIDKVGYTGAVLIGILLVSVILFIYYLLP